MSILIKGMEMPTNCRACYLKMNCDDCEGLECVCVPLHQQIGYLGDLLTDKRREDCPLVPVPPHGKWEKHDDGIMFWWECSECHQDPWYDREELYDYCPSCGAKMEFWESEEEDD